MRIGIDGTPLTIPFSCGTKNFAENLILYLSKIDNFNTYYIFASKKVDIPTKKNFIFVKTPNVLPIFKRQFFLNHYAKKANLDVFHYLQPYGDVFWKHKSIITSVHDVDLNATYPYFSKYFLNRVICEVTRHFVFKNTKLFLVPTPTIRNELDKLLKRNKKKPNIMAIPYGVDTVFAKRRTNNSDGNILCLGDFSERKNTYNVMVSYSGLPLIYKKSHGLVIVASTRKAAQKYKYLSERLNIDSFTKIYANLSKNKLSDMYKKSLLFVFPSLYEGFGLPILEAMRSGCPVITSNYGAMRDVAGNAALFVDPRSPVAMSQAIIKMLKSENLREKFIQKGYKRVKNFSWLKFAKEMLALYNTQPLKN